MTVFLRLMDNILVLTRNIDEVITCLIADSIDETAIARQGSSSGLLYVVCCEEWLSLS